MKYHDIFVIELASCDRGADVTFFLFTAVLQSQAAWGSCHKPQSQVHEAARGSPGQAKLAALERFTRIRLTRPGLTTQLLTRQGLTRAGLTCQGLTRPRLTSPENQQTSQVSQPFRPEHIKNTMFFFQHFHPICECASGPALSRNGAINEMTKLSNSHFSPETSEMLERSIF